MSIAAMTAIVLILLTLTGVLRHTVEETGIKNTHVIYWLICVICLKAFLLNPTPEIELNFGLVPIIIGPAVLLPQRAPQTGSFRLLLYSELSIC